MKQLMNERATCKTYKTNKLELNILNVWKNNTSPSKQLLSSNKTVIHIPYLHYMICLIYRHICIMTLLAAWVFLNFVKCDWCGGDLSRCTLVYKPYGLCVLE